MTGMTGMTGLTGSAGNTGTTGSTGAAAGATADFTSAYNITAKALIASGVTTLTPTTGSTVTINCSLGNLFLVTLPTAGTAVTIATPSNPSAGQSINIVFTQGTSNTTVTWPASTVIKWVNGVKTISTGSGVITLVSMVYIGSIWYASLGPALA
jgi:hypothetical protein